MISEEEARTRILAKVEPLPARSVHLIDAIDCFAAQTYLATVPLPGFDNSAMDGYAVIAASCNRGSRLRLVGAQPAGLDKQLSVSAGEAVRIFTGAPVPKGADAVVMQEDVTVDGEEVVINATVASGEFVRRRGSDVSEGQKILDTGERIRPVTAAALASQGLASVAVGGKVTVGIISTGDELKKPGEKLQPGQIYDGNSVLLEGLARNCGAAIGSVEHCNDDLGAVTAALDRGLQQSVLIISGGVSVGEHDLVKAALRALGVTLDIWRVAIKPGKPFLFGRSERSVVFGLPGNPVSSFVTFLEFVRPAILRMMGANEGELRLPTVMAELMEDVAGDAERPHYIRGRLTAGKFRPVGRQESHAVFGLSQSNALLRVAAGTSFNRGMTVPVEVWD